MARCLGADLYKSVPWFPHPVTKEDICIFLDPAHMVKLVENTLGDYGVLYDADDKLIEWRYFKDLVTLQEDEKIHLATKIRRRHIHYSKEIWFDWLHKYSAIVLLMPFFIVRQNKLMVLVIVKQQ